MSFQATAFPPAGSLPPEIAFLAAEGVDPRLLVRAAAMARQAGTDAASPLLYAGLIDEEGYYRALARTLGAPFLAGPIPFAAPLPYPHCLRAGAAPLAPGAGAALVLAPRGSSIAPLLAGRCAGLAAITTPTRLRQAVHGAFPELVATHAAEDLRTHDPGRAVSGRPMGGVLLLLALTLAAGLSLLSALPAPVVDAVAVAGQVLCLATMLFRVAAVAIPPTAVEVPPLPDTALPRYTVLIPLYREAAILPRIVPALASLDYPAAKLDIKFLIEADDAETAAALAQWPFPARFEVVTVPPGRPRTKPRALNAALPLVRGDLLVVYDAEDVFEPDQLRKAAAIFARSPASVACLQGHLVIDNHEGPLTRLFALEYAGLFDVLNPALAALGMPIPLGGTSMHLRTEIIRKLRGWDARNVTEDADLGLRLALAGYRVGDLPSVTYEEAPVSIRAWLHQRIRWMKGFLQTSLVHASQPVATFTRLGPLRSLCALALVPGTVVSALVYPFAVAWVIASVALGWIEISAHPLANLRLSLALLLFLCGLVAMTGPALLGCRRRGWRDLWRYVPALPFYYLGLSAAAWLAVVELVRAPERWNKTEHGLSRVSRSGRLTRVRAVRPMPDRGLGNP